MSAFVIRCKPNQLKLCLNESSLSRAITHRANTPKYNDESFRSRKIFSPDHTQTRSRTNTVGDDSVMERSCSLIRGRPSNQTARDTSSNRAPLRTSFSVMASKQIDESVLMSETKKKLKGQPSRTMTSPQCTLTEPDDRQLTNRTSGRKDTLRKKPQDVIRCRPTAENKIRFSINISAIGKKARSNNTPQVSAFTEPDECVNVTSSSRINTLDSEISARRSAITAFFDEVLQFNEALPKERQLSKGRRCQSRPKVSEAVGDMFEFSAKLPSGAKMETTHCAIGSLAETDQSAVEYFSHNDLKSKVASHTLTLDSSRNSSRRSSRLEVKECSTKPAEPSSNNLSIKLDNDSTDERIVETDEEYRIRPFKEILASKTATGSRDSRLSLHQAANAASSLKRDEDSGSKKSSRNDNEVKHQSSLNILTGFNHVTALSHMSPKSQNERKTQPFPQIHQSKDLTSSGSKRQSEIFTVAEDPQEEEAISFIEPILDENASSPEKSTANTKSEGRKAILMEETNISDASPILYKCSGQLEHKIEPQDEMAMERLALVDQPIAELPCRSKVYHATANKEKKDKKERRTDTYAFPGDLIRPAEERDKKKLLFKLSSIKKHVPPLSARDNTVIQSTDVLSSTGKENLIARSKNEEIQEYGYTEPRVSAPLSDRDFQRNNVQQQ